MAWDKDQIVELLLEAGQIGLRSKKNLRREFKADASIVTQADREIEDLLARALEDTESGIYIIGEETVAQKGEDYLQCAIREEAFVIDPIDGTSPYAYGMPSWGVSLGRMEHGRLVDGAVYLPDFGELVLSDGGVVLEGVLQGGGLTWRELPRPAREEGYCQLVGITQAIAKRGKVLVENPVQVLGAAVVPLVGLVQGRFLGYLGSVYLWDAAGALPLAMRHGFSVIVRDGEQVVRFEGDVDDKIFFLDASSRTRWKFRGDLMICHAEDEERMLKALVTE